MHMKITRAVTADIPELCILLHDLFSREVEFEPDFEVQARGIAAVIDDPAVGDILVARESDRVLGMINVLYTVSTALGGPVAVFEDMIVSPYSRGGGIGSALMGRAIELAGTKGCRRITLLADSDNEAAHRFYHRHGFSRSSMQTFRMLLDQV
jgi:GNAT superfamily N-acetyltransferase